MCSHRVRLFHRFLISAAVLFSFALASAGASDLRFQVSGIEAGRGGTICAGVYASEEGYLDPGFQIAQVAYPISGAITSGVFTNLPPGNYVIAILHDEDGDYLMKTGALGMPKEGYGFSGVDKAKMKPPKFEKAAISLDGTESAELEIFMNYL